jgi:limonene-1,2-epoxide hydrolase
VVGGDRAQKASREDETMTQSTARKLVDTYFAAMAAKDFAAIRPLLHDDVTFKGALGTTNGVDDYIAGLRQTLANMLEVKRHAISAEGENVFQVYDLILSKPDVTIPVAQWLRVRDGRIASLQVFFNPRPLMG